jgi:hypothetical protein
MVLVEFVSLPSSTDVSEFEESDFDLVDQEERKLPSSEFNFELASESPDENTSLSVEELEFTAEKLAVADIDSADSDDFNFDFDLSELETEALKAEDLSEIVWMLKICLMT